MRERTAQPRRKQGRAPHRDRLGKIYKAPQQNDLHQLRRRQGQAARQQPSLGALIDKPPHRGRSHRRRAQFDAQQGGLERYPRRQRAHRCRQAVGRRAADDQRQPKGGRPAVDLPGPQRQPTRQRRALPQQRRAARTGQQLVHIGM